MCLEKPVIIVIHHSRYLIMYHLNHHKDHRPVKKGKVNLNSEQELSDINDETQEKEKFTERERGGERCEKYTHTHTSRTYVM